MMAVDNVSDELGTKDGPGAETDPEVENPDKPEVSPADAGYEGSVGKPNS